MTAPARLSLARNVHHPPRFAGEDVRELRPPQPVDGARANDTAGNGVLVLARPEAGPGSPPGAAECRLQVVGAPRGQRVGHHGYDLGPASTAAHRRQTEAVVARAHAGDREPPPSDGGSRAMEAWRSAWLVSHLMRYDLQDRQVW